MKKIISLLFVMLLLCFSSISVFAASDTSSAPEMSVTITSPTSIESKPICEENIEITVKNLTDHELTNLAAYLMILDEGRNMTYPVDEFGQNAYQTRNITSIPENGEVKVTIPVKITYVGNFKFNVSVINYNNDYVTTSNTLSVKMIENSKMNKAIVMAVAVVVPIVLACVVFIIVKRKKLKK
jgi:hypothetical protein